MTIRQTIAKFFRLGPKPEEMRLCTDCKWCNATNTVCQRVESIRNDFVNGGKVHSIRNTSCYFERNSDCGPRGKYWEGKE